MYDFCHIFVRGYNSSCSGPIEPILSGLVVPRSLTKSRYMGPYDPVVSEIDRFIKKLLRWVLPQVFNNNKNKNNKNKKKYFEKLIV